MARPAGLLQGYRLVTDAYLVCLAARNDGVLATLDKGVEYEECVTTIWGNIGCHTAIEII